MSGPRSSPGRSRADESAISAALRSWRLRRAAAARAFERDPAGDLVQPGAQRIPHPQRPGLARQHEEDRLEGVFRRMLVPQDRAAGAQDRRAVPLDQGREGTLARLVALAAEFLQQLRVRQPAGRPRPEEHLDVPQGGAKSAFCHPPFPRRSSSPFRYHVAPRPDWSRFLQKILEESSGLRLSLSHGPPPRLGEGGPDGDRT